MSDAVIPLSASKVEELEGALLELPPAEIKTLHTFAPGIYVREMRVPAGCVVIGHEHLTDHVNILLKGSLVIVTGENEGARMQAPCTFVASAGVRKVAEFLEDSIWLNIMPNPDNEQRIDVLDDRFVRKSATFLAHQKKAAIADNLNPVSN